jgi:hydrogenase expression/formation protein HypE
MDALHKKETNRIVMAHGSGGRLMHNLIKDVFLKHLKSAELAKLDDAAELVIDNQRLAFSTDTFVVKPVFFPGGDIGSLAISGTVNDLLVQGARPLYISSGFVIEAGFPMADLIRILESISLTAEQAGVRVVTGDTKVVGKGEMDGIFINTSGIGTVLSDVNVGGNNARIGDSIIVSGDIGRHGIAVIAERNGLKLKGDIKSDAAPLTGSLIPLLERFKKDIHVLRDPTRGGVATVLNEIAETSKVTIAIKESSIPISEGVGSVSDLLGFEPLYLPCEGRFVAFVDPGIADKVVEFSRGLPDCRNCGIIGRVEAESEGEVILETAIGGRRFIDTPAGEMLPRIC